MEDLSKYDVDFFLFLESVFIAANQADEDAADKLLKACELLRPGNTFIRIGRGYVHLLKLELKAACQHFEAVLQQEPEHELAKTLLGIALSLTPDKVSKGEQFLENVVINTSNPHAKETANTMLDFVAQFVKKQGPNPAKTEL